VRRITSRQNALVSTFRAVARGDQPGMLLDGPHLVADALAARVAVRHAMVTADGLERDEIAALVGELERSRVDVVSIPQTVMAAVSPVRSSSAIVAVADRPQFSHEQMYRGTPLVVIACDVQDPGNLGAIVRVAEAAGGSGVIAAGRSADPFGPKALRGSMGSTLRMPVLAGDAVAAMNDARRRGCRILAAVPRGGRSLFDLDLTGPVALVVGGEGAGLPAELVGTADERFTVPMQGQAESLNAAVTAAVAMYEAYRQRSRLRSPERA
jgi:TrmH family RNA methyltransferase